MILLIELEIILIKIVKRLGHLMVRGYRICFIILFFFISLSVYQSMNTFLVSPLCMYSCMAHVCFRNFLCIICHFLMH